LEVSAGDAGWKASGDALDGYGAIPVAVSFDRAIDNRVELI
jgi:hypothetical protein